MSFVVFVISYMHINIYIYTVCMYVCMYVYMYVCTYVHTCYVLIKPPIPYTYVCIHTYVCIYLCMYVYKYRNIRS